MWHLFFPTAQNHYRAKLLTTPVLVLMAIGIFLFNTVIGVVPVAKVSASIATQNLLTLHNQERSKAGLQPLKINVALTNSAQQKAQAMLDSDCWSHYCPNGKSPWDFFNSAGYNYLYAGENLAEGFFNDEDVMVAWMNSPSHRVNILKPEYTEVGFGVVTGKFQGKENNVVIVVHFGTPQPTTTASSDSSSSSSGTFKPPLQAPDINVPKDNTATNSTEITISGTAPGAKQVEIARNGAKWVTADANEGIFTYKATGLTEQDYQLIATSYTDTQKSDASIPVTFQVDTTPDPIETKQIIVTDVSAEQNLDLQINAPTLSQVTLQINGKSYDFVHSTNNLWTGSIPEASFYSTPTFTISDKDKAGNSWQSNMDTATIISKTKDLLNSNANTVGSVLGAQTKAQVNTIFLVILALLFGADFLILSRTGVTREANSKSHFHFAMFAIIGIIAVTGMMSGQVGAGLVNLH